MPIQLRPRPLLAAAALVALAACAAGARRAAAASSDVIAAQARARPERWAFTAFWDPRSAASLTSHGRTLDVAVTTWIALDSTTGAPTVLHAAPRREAGPARTMALVTSWMGQRFHPGAVRRLASDPAALRAAARQVARQVAGLGHQGMVLDLEGHVATDTATLRAIVAAFARASSDAGAGPVTVAIPAGDTLAYPSRLFIDAGAASVLPMLYDQHWAGGDAGPVAAPGWVRQWLAVRVREVGASRVVAGLPLYGYHWKAAGQGETVTHAEALALTARSGGRLVRDSASGTMHASVGTGELWVTDAGLMARLLDEVEAAGVGRVAFWYIGQEDPALWPLLETRPRR